VLGFFVFHGVQRCSCACNPPRNSSMDRYDALYSQFTGTTDVFALQQLADNISIISPRAAATANNVTYWMGTDKFNVYSGQIQTLPTTVREYVYKDINYAQSDQIVSGTNEGFNEVWWFYPVPTPTGTTDTLFTTT
jgi:hypothetical protein